MIVLQRNDLRSRKRPTFCRHCSEVTDLIIWRSSLGQRPGTLWPRWAASRRWPSPCRVSPPSPPPLFTTPLTHPLPSPRLLRRCHRERDAGGLRKGVAFDAKRFGAPAERLHGHRNGGLEPAQVARDPRHGTGRPEVLSGQVGLHGVHGLRRDRRVWPPLRPLSAGLASPDISH